MPDDRTQQNTAAADHDLLIKLDTKFDIMSDKFDALSSNLVSRVDSLEKDAAVAKQTSLENSGDIKELKKDIGFLNRYAWMALGMVALVEAYLAYRQLHP